MSFMTLQDGLNILKGDIQDTEVNTTNVIGALVDIQNFDGIVPSAEYTQWINTSTPITFTMYDRIFLLRRENSSSLSVLLSTYGQNDNLIDLSEVIHYDSTTNKLSVNNDSLTNNLSVKDLTVNDSFNLQYTLDEIVNHLLEINNSNILFRDAIDSVLSADGNNALQRFSALNNAVNTHLSNNNIILYNDLIRALSCQDPKSGLLNYIGNVYKSLTETSTNSDSRIILNDTSYYVEGFFGKQMIGQIISTAAQVISGVVSFVYPIVGFTLSLVSSGIGAFINAFKQLDEQTVVNIDDTASGSNFANRLTSFTIPYSSLTYTTITTPADNLGPGNGSNPTVNTNYYLGRLLYLLENEGCVVLRIQNFSFIISKDNSPSTLYVEVYANFDYYRGTIEGYLPYYMTKVSETEYQLATRQPINDWSSAFNVIQTYFGAESYVNTSDLACRTQLAYCAAMLLCFATDNNSSDYHQRFSRGRPSYSSSMSIVDLQKWLLDVNDPSYINTAASWEHLVNHVIPSVSNLINNGTHNEKQRLIYAIGGILNVDIYEFNTNTITASKKAFKINCVPSSSTFKFYPPAYSKNAVRNTLLILAAATVVTAAVAITTKVVQRKIRKSLTRANADVEAAKYRYEQNPTDANFNEYWRLSRRYNMKATLIGYSKISPIESSTSRNNKSTDENSLFSQLSSISSGDKMSDLTQNVDIVKHLISD